MDLTLVPLDGRVDLKGLLGSGGMGEVHRGWDRTLQRAVAVKFVLGQGPQAEERLLLEARLQARVEHPNVVKVHEIGTLQGKACIVFQLVEGRSLAQIAPGLPLAARVELLRQAAAGLHAAHRQGLVHRDVKPGNVLVEDFDGRSRALVTDFGLARAEDGSLSRTGQPPGTLDYMSPEQLLGPGPADFRSDVYALGATLYATLAGRPPFRTPLADEDQGQLLRRIAEEDPEPLERAGAPRELSLIAARAMEKDPAARYPSAEAFGDDLGRFQRGEPIRARPPTPAERVRKWARRNRGAARALLAGTLAVILALGWTLWSSRRAGLAALEAARLGALAEAMEADLRMEHLAPPHDLRPAIARIRADVEALRPEAARGGGPPNFALGKGLELTGDLEGARAAYERAWAAGLRTPRVAAGLGTTLGILYRRSWELARDTLAPAPREERLRALRADLREPAIRHLALGGDAGWRVPFFKATVALLEEDFAAARARAAEALAADPGRYEALGIQVDAWLEQARQQAGKNDLDGAESSLAQAEQVLEQALAFGRSDPGLALAGAKLHGQRMTIVVRRGKKPDVVGKRLAAALEHAAVLDPDDTAILVMRGDALLREAQYALDADAQGALGQADAALALYRRALGIDPGDVRALRRMGAGANLRAYHLRETGQPDAALAAAQEGLTALEKAIALTPMDMEAHHLSSMLLEVEAETLRNQGKPASAVLRRALAEGELGMQLNPARAAAIRSSLAEVLVELAREEWQEGRDPRESIRRGTARGEESTRKDPSSLARLATVYSRGADLLAAVGDDFRPSLARAAALLDEAQAAQPDLVIVLELEGEIRAQDAWLRSCAGEDPRGPAAEARRWLDKAAAKGDHEVDLLDAYARLPLSEAVWLASSGLDPGASLERAEQRVQALFKAWPDQIAGHLLLSQSALVRARWLARKGLSPAAAARSGLDHLEIALARQPRDPALWTRRAQLQALAGDREQAQKSLDRALSINALVREGREAKDALAVLAGGGPR